MRLRNVRSQQSTSPDEILKEIRDRLEKEYKKFYRSRFETISCFNNFFFLETTKIYLLKNIRNHVDGGEIKMEEKTVEQLQKELLDLKDQRIVELEEQLRGSPERSNIVPQKGSPARMNHGEHPEEFLERYKSRHNLSGKRYEDIIAELSEKAMST